MNQTVPVITIDGPSGVGKGTVSRKLANILGWNLLDSGVIYRILVTTALSKNIDLHNAEELVDFISKIKIDFIRVKNKFFIFCNNKQINKNIHTEFIGNLASKIAEHPKIRVALLKYQRQYCRFPGLIADGRDMGTIIFPNAIVKFFLYASNKERQYRRLDQLRKTDFNVNFKFLVSQIKERDDRDYNRKIAPAVPAADAFILDSTYLSEVEVINTMRTYIKIKTTLI